MYYNIFYGGELRFELCPQMISTNLQEPLVENDSLDPVIDHGDDEYE